MSKAWVRRIGAALLGAMLLLQAPDAAAKKPKQRDVILATETRGIPPGFHKEERPNNGLVIGGAVTAGIGATFFMTGFTGLRGDGYGLSTQQGALMAVGGAGTLAGLSLLVTGLLSPRTVYVRNEPSNVAFQLSASHRDLSARVRVDF